MNKNLEILRNKCLIISCLLTVLVISIFLVIQKQKEGRVGYDGNIINTSGISNVSEDTSPTLGGNLDGGGYNISSVGSGTSTNWAVLNELAIPTSTNPTVDRAGEFALNTTVASSSFRVNIGGTEYALFPDIEPAFTITTSTLDSFNGQTVSSSIPIGFASIHGETWSRAVCKTTNGTAELEFGDGTNYMNYIKLTTSPSVTVLSANNTFVMDEAREVRVGKVSSTGAITCTVTVLRNAD